MDAIDNDSWGEWVGRERWDCFLRLVSVSRSVSAVSLLFSWITITQFKMTTQTWHTLHWQCRAVVVNTVHLSFEGAKLNKVSCRHLSHFRWGLSKLYDNQQLQTEMPARLLLLLLFCTWSQSFHNYFPWISFNWEMQGYSPFSVSPCKQLQRLHGQSDPWHWTRRCQQRWEPSWQRPPWLFSLTGAGWSLASYHHSVGVWVTTKRGFNLDFLCPLQSILILLLSPSLLTDPLLLLLLSRAFSLHWLERLTSCSLTTLIVIAPNSVLFWLCSWYPTCFW